MTVLAQTALDFCRECLGWADVPAYDITDGVAFRFNDLNAVMEAVQEWCNKANASLVLGYGRYAKGDWDASITTSAGGELFLNRSPCHALLTACVEASRKLNHGSTP